MDDIVEKELQLLVLSSLDYITVFYYYITMLHSRFFTVFHCSYTVQIIINIFYSNVGFVRYFM